MKMIKADIGKSSYNIYIYSGISAKTGALLKEKVRGKKVLLISNKKIYSLHGAKLKKTLDAYFDCKVLLIPDGEKYKNIKTLQSIYAACAKAGLDRSSAIVGFGGGVIGDLAGFAAATYMRGITLAHVPTTLLAQVDSAIGGKTGFDLPEGKNLVGAFYQPALVVSDTEFLKTLSESEYRNGLAEVVKYGIISDKTFFEYLEKNSKAILKRNQQEIKYLVGKSAEIKVMVVSKDEKETTGGRAILNYGHTLGHAIEAAAKYKGYKHGEAIAIGMLMAAGISKEAGYCNTATVKRQENLLKQYKLIKPLKKLEKKVIVAHLRSDKKARDGKIGFVFMNEIGTAVFEQNADMRVINKELAKFKIS